MITVTSYMIRRRFYPPKDEVSRDYFSGPDDRKVWSKDYQDWYEDDE